MRGIVRVFMFVAILWVTAGSLAAQQAGVAVLSGRVTDATGGVIGGATITFTNKATGGSREVTTNLDGIYVLPSLPAGEYELKIVANGFSETVYKSVVLHVGETTQLDISPKIAGVNQKIIIDETAAPLINTTSTVVDGIIGAQSIESLPLNGRNFLELALLVPGNSPAPNFDPTKTKVVLISSAGQLGRTGNVSIDGADNNDDAVGGPLQNISQDAVQEFQIATNRFSAELGRSGSSVINIVTKSGTNDLHGVASFYFRDRYLQGLPATYDRSNGTPSFHREQYSGAAGGPIVRDKAWWFASGEYRNQDAVELVGQRNFDPILLTRNIIQIFAPAPLTDGLSTERLDWDPTGADRLNFRYSFEREADKGVNARLRALASATYRNNNTNNYHSFLSNWNRVLSVSAVNSFSFSFNHFQNDIEPLTVAPQHTFPSILDGAGFDVPQATRQNRYQFSDTFSLQRGAHSMHFGGEAQILHDDFFLGVFRQGRVELVENFPDFDRNNDGVVDDNDLLFAVTLRSGNAEPLDLNNSNNTHYAAFFQDDWRLRKSLTLNLGLRYEIDTDVKNVSRFDQLNPLLAPFVHGKRGRDTNNFGPRVGFNWAPGDGRTSIHGGYGIYYDRVTLEIQSLERGLDGRSLPIEVRAGNALTDPTGAPIFLDSTGHFVPGAPTLDNPFTGFILPGAGASGINLIGNNLQNPEVQQFNLGVQRAIGSDFVVRADYLHNLGTHFIINRNIGTVFNPVVGGPDSVVSLESSVVAKYDGLLLSAEKRLAHRVQFRGSYTLSKTLNYANDEQIPFASGPIDSNNLRLEYGPSPNDQRHRFTFSGLFQLPYGFDVAPIWTVASGVPMDILMPDGQTRIPIIQRNAGGRQFHNGAELNAFITQVNANGGINGQLLPLVNPDVHFSDSFNSLDMRISRKIKLSERFSVEPMMEVFNLFNVTNILGTSNVNYSGYSNALARDSSNPASPGFLTSSSFGRAVSTAGGVFGSGGPRAFQLAVRLNF